QGRAAAGASSRVTSWDGHRDMPEPAVVALDNHGAVAPRVPAADCSIIAPRAPGPRGPPDQSTQGIGAGHAPGSPRTAEGRKQRPRWNPDPRIDLMRAAH